MTARVAAPTTWTSLSSRQPCRTMATVCKARGSIHSQDGCLFHRSPDQGARHGKSYSESVSSGRNASSENHTLPWEERQNGRSHKDCPSRNLSSALWETPSETTCASNKGTSPIHSSPSCATNYRLCKQAPSNGQQLSPKQDGDGWNHLKSEAGRPTVRSGNSSSNINRTWSDNHSEKELDRRSSTEPAFAAIVPHQLEERQQEAEPRESSQSSFSHTLLIYEESLHECRSEDSESIKSFRMHDSRPSIEQIEPVQLFPTEREEHQQDSFADSVDARQRCSGGSRFWKCCRWPRADSTRVHQGQQPLPRQQQLQQSQSQTR